MSINIKVYDSADSNSKTVTVKEDDLTKTFIRSYVSNNNLKKKKLLSSTFGYKLVDGTTGKKVEKNSKTLDCVSKKRFYVIMSNVEAKCTENKIWAFVIGCFVYSLIFNFLRWNGIMLGGLPTIILFSLCISVFESIAVFFNGKLKRKNGVFLNSIINKEREKNGIEYSEKKLYSLLYELSENIKNYNKDEKLDINQRQFTDDCFAESNFETTCKKCKKTIKIYLNNIQREHYGRLKAISSGLYLKGLESDVSFLCDNCSNNNKNVAFGITFPAFEKKYLFKCKLGEESCAILNTVFAFLDGAITVNKIAKESQVMPDESLENPEEIYIKNVTRILFPDLYNKPIDEIITACKEKIQNKDTAQFYNENVICNGQQISYSQPMDFKSETKEECVSETHYPEIKNDDEGINRTSEDVSKTIDFDDDIKVETASIKEETCVKPKILFCRKCGAKLIENAAFCFKCGTKIE